MAKVMGFFSDDTLSSIKSQNDKGNCEKCGLAEGCKTPQMGYTGKGGKQILIVAEAPSDADDRSGKPLSGETSEWFAEKLKRLGIDMDRDCWKTNAVGCHPATMKDKKPTKAHVKHCAPRLQATIEELKPKYIWLMGSDAIYSYYHHRETNVNVERWRGLCIPDPEKKAWIIPMYHPVYAVKMQKDDHFQSVYDRDLKFAVKCASFHERPEAMDISGVKILKKFEDVADILEKVLRDKPKKFAFDYETTGLKPYRSGHRIATMSFCTDYDTAYAFPYQYNNHWLKEQLVYIGDLWADIMNDPDIRKVMHNSKFEDMWTREIVGSDIVNKWWCSMNVAHLLDNRKEFSGLKFQALIRWGIPDYDSEIERFLKSVDGTPYNTVMKAPLNDLLLYNGIDALLTYRLQEEQEHEMKAIPKMQNAKDLTMKGLHVLCNLQENGIPMNRKYYLDQEVILGNRIEDMKARLHSFPEAQRFLREKGRPVNFGSSQDLDELFFTLMNLESTKKTPGGKNCVDASVLAELDTPIAKEITNISKLEKIKGTYLGQFNREIEDDSKLHPFFDLHTVRTNRGSSSSPNFQNIPVRDQEAMTITRGGIIPSRGNKLSDWDYGAMEVRIIACITQDPVLVNYCTDLSTDMHRDQAMDSFSFTKAEWDELVAWDKANKTKCAKNIRFHAKNGEVFAWFYGSYYRSSARSLFPLLKELQAGPMSLFEWLRHKKVIRSLSTAADDFEAHLKKVEKRFWDKYKKVKQWQEKAFATYLEKGYIEQMFGHRCSGYLSRNDICNYPVQGTAFHCLVWSLDQLDIRMKDEKMDSKLIGQIHDCCLGDIVPEEEPHWCYISNKIATREIREANKWIIVPLLAEFEHSEIDEPWSMKKEFHPTL